MVRVSDVDSPLALYRRYRPETFAEVIGQDHVTTPLRNALANNRVNHAYLFSGPRGCGKTTSARILARALNCEKAPVADPCGECDSCRDLARGGPGSIDVIEIDAASHNGVDDARDLREKAFFAPVRSRYKVYIIDEAHMVTAQAFNAMLKLVEEPPPHLRFIFATTEPDKVIPTIRSRTHHYPFRLFPPKLVADYIATLCEKEGIAVEPAALPLVARAGGGSMRDSLSVMDQLLGGAGPQGVTYELAVGLLGYTPDWLLDEVVDAFAARDGAAVFGVIDKVIETGQDPRRFTEDLLRRLRDLVIVAAVPDAPASGLVEVSEDAGERLVAQANRFGVHELSRAADIVATGLTEMRGATAPRLLLELVCARVLLPGADHGTEGLAARLDRLERRVDISGTPSPAPAPAPAAPAQDRPVLKPSVGAPRSGDSAPVPDERSVAPPPPPTAGGEPATVPDERSVAAPPPPEEGHPETAHPEPEPAQPATGGLTLVDVRRLWPDVVEAVKTRRRMAWIHLTQNSQVVALDGNVLTLGFTNPGARESFVNGRSDEVVRQAVIDVVGADWRIEAIVDPGAQAGGPPPEPPRGSAPPTPPGSGSQPGPPGGAPPGDPGSDPAAIAKARGAIRPTRTGEQPPSVEDRAARLAQADADAHPDDLDADVEVLGGAELLQRELGAQMIEEIRHQ
ncbi:DNA polymerase III subunit gamma and tau [Nocardioides sp. KR10-350]|uniref:DNA polymerase III subunit gamma and tau n=1 Tax=Nocardioides cheoyonin TaxID=3156615 RepID=UPI0032B4F675